MTDLYYNAKFFTGDTFAEAVLVEDGRFVFIGTKEEALANHTGGAKIDLNKTLVIPGFNDSHMHLYGMTFVMERLALHDVDSIPSLQAKLLSYWQSPGVQRRVHRRPRVQPRFF
ncbi:MAG: hypothetical protein MZU97_01010 [Bacillus subtilis]|nr:hypothetical protein [Bacillus subtilis]